MSEIDTNEASKHKKTTSIAIERSALNANKMETSIALKVVHFIERILLTIVVFMTLTAVIFEINTMHTAQNITLADILLMFLYIEVIGMVTVFYSDRQSAFIYPIFIAITALARLIVLQGKEMEPENILYEAIAILVLATAATILLKWRPR